jgi:hypothetical protein
MGRLARYHCARQSGGPANSLGFSRLGFLLGRPPKPHDTSYQFHQDQEAKKNREGPHAQSLTPPNHARTVSGDAAPSAGPRTRKLCTPAFDLAGRTQARGSRHALLDTTGLFAVATHRRVRRLHQAPLAGSMAARPTIRRAVVAGWAYAPADAAARRKDSTAPHAPTRPRETMHATRPGRQQDARVRLGGACVARSRSAQPARALPAGWVLWSLGMPDRGRAL